MKESVKFALAIASKVIGFALAASWVMGLIWVGILLADPFYTLTGKNMLLLAWYTVTVVYVGVRAALYGMRLIGQWIWKEEEEEKP